MAADARSTSARDWRYVAEGGATIVFSYLGPESPTFTGTVLRIRKTPLPMIPIPPKSSEQEDAEWESEQDDPTIAFQARVSSQFLPPANLPRLESVRVSYAFLQELSTLVQPVRPAERVTKDAIDLSRRRAVLATDLVGRSDGSLIIEIKPKWAFLPRQTHLSPETREVKTNHSRFVMHTYRRSLEEGKVVGADIGSNYDPIDLVSQDEDRVRRAMGALWDAWVASDGAVNNLRVFCDGQSLTPSASDTSLLISKSLSLETGSTHSLDVLRTHFIDHTSGFLTRAPLLPRLSQLQRTLDSLDIEGLSSLWSQVHSSVPFGYGPEPSLEEWEAFTREYTAMSDEHREREAESPTANKESLKYHVLAYLMSATFKDCSLIVRYPRPSNRAELEQPSITAIDLDPKSVKRLEKWEKLDRQIALAYAARRIPPLV